MLINSELLELIKEKSRLIRVHALTAITKASSGHPGGSLSATDILAVLYFGVMRHDASHPDSPDRDYLVISKGHISPSVYSCLGLAGYFPVEDFVSSFRQFGTAYQGHIDSHRVKGVEVSTGSLGQGLSIANGLAMGLRLAKKPNHVFALISDGELQEGQMWEALMTANHYKLNNITVILDRNRIQLDGFTEDTMQLEPLADKFTAFGWEVSEIDGHDIGQLYTALHTTKNRTTNKPHIIIANTIKGKGVSFMENQSKWHGSPPSQEQLQQALAELH